MTTLAWAVWPLASVAVTVAVNLPGPYWCCTTGPSATEPSPRSQWYVAASPLAVSDTVSGAAPSVALACTLTIGVAWAGAAQTKKTARTGAMRRIAKRLARDPNDEPEGVEGRVEQHARVDAVRPRAEVGEAGPEHEDDREARDQPVDEREREPDEQNGRGGPEALEESVADAAELELLDDRRDDYDDECEGRERGDLARVPVLRDQALLFLGVPELVDDSADDEDRDQDQRPRSRPLASTTSVAGRRGNAGDRARA